MCELLVGLPEVNFLGIDDVVGDPLRVHIVADDGPVDMRTPTRSLRPWRSSRWPATPA